MGANDYVTKPFSPKELMARIKAVLKRSLNTDNFVYSDLVIDYLGHTVKIDGKEFYEVSGKYSPSTLYSENTEKISVYVEKETGLTIKKVEIINENGQKVENITTFEYKFDSVTDEDVKEPN